MMADSTPVVEFQATDFFHNQSAHALLISAFYKAKNLGLFAKFQQHLKLKMKKRTFSWIDKLTTLWASIVVGCNHTVEINDKLGSHEQAMAALLGLDHFPDQSQVNRLLWAFSSDHIQQWRRLHLDLLCRHTKARNRGHWLRLANHQRLLAVDLDQRALTVSCNQFELSKKGYFGRKRGRYGYQLSVAFMGGGVSEVIDEYFDSGETPAAHRLEPLLDSLREVCRRTRIPADCILIRGDAQFGTPANLKKIKARGFHYLVKGMNSQRARKLLTKVDDEKIFWQVENGARQAPAWMCDQGEIEHREGRRRAKEHAVLSRTLLMVRQLKMPASKRADPKRREQLKAAGQYYKSEIKVDYFLTDLDCRQLPIGQVLEVYHDRSTIERYFYDEQYALGARQVRTHHFAGEAVFQFLVATTNNLLRWMQKSTFRGTILEKIGLGRLIRQGMQIPARVTRKAEKWIVEMPKQHHLVKQLLKSWAELSPT